MNYRKSYGSAYIISVNVHVKKGKSFLLAISTSTCIDLETHFKVNTKVDSI